MYKPKNMDLKLYQLYFGTNFGDIRESHVHWSTCREVLLSYFRSNPNPHGILLAPPKGRVSTRIEALRRMSHRLQKRMGLKPADCFTIDDTENTNIVYIGLPAFWQRLHRVDFLTAFLRSSMNLKYKTLAQVLRNGKYLNNTRPAVRLFVAGKNEIRHNPQGGLFSGWSKTFRRKTSSEVAKILS